MRITIAHKKSKDAVKESIDQGIADALKTIQSVPVEVSNIQRSWNGYVLTFSLTARAGFLKSPIAGTVEVADTWVLINVDLGMFGHFLPEEKAQEAIKSKVRGLLA